MAVYTYISGLESDAVGLYANELLSSLATRTIGSFTKNTAAGLFAFISSQERRTYVYEPSLIDLYNELDFGFIIDVTSCVITPIGTVVVSTNTIAPTCAVRIDIGATVTINPSSIYTVPVQASTPNIYKNWGSITDSTATAEDYGRIYYVSNIESFGFVKFVSEASWKATQAWQGSGNIGLFGKESSPAFYNYNTSNRLRGLEGSSSYVFSPALPSRGGLSLFGESPIGISLRIIIDASTLFSFSSLDEKKTFDYPATEGSLSILGGVSDVDTTFAYFAEGTLFNFSGLDEKASYDYQGSGRLFGFNNLEEARVYRYDCHDSNAIDYFVESDYGYVERCITTETITGDISGSSTSCTCVVQQGTTARIVNNQSYSVALNSDIATIFIDYGYITNPADALLDFGYILTTSNVMPCGSIRFNKEIASTNKFTPNWNGEGIISISGASRIPLDVAVYGTGSIKNLGGSAETAAFAEETKDLFRVTGDATIGITAITIQDGNLFGFSGAAEATTVNPPEETQLFAISGGILTEKHSESYIGEGILFALETVIEKNVYSYVGSGGLFGFNNLEEARTYVYDCESVVPFLDLDYGLIVSGNNQQLSCVDVSGVISSNTVSTTGCTKVPPGTTLEIVPGVTYTIPSQLTVPQNYNDYGLVSELHDPVVDYGWILGTFRDGMPGCIYGQIDITGSATDKFTPSWTGSGNIAIAGQSRVPLDVAVYGTGSIKNLGGAAETSAIAEESTGLFKITGTSIIGITAITIGDGSLFGFSGSSDSVGFNPPDITTDIKISGASGDPLLTYREIGFGNLFTLQGATQSSVYSYVGSGSLFTLNKLEEARTYVYDCESIVEYRYFDYGLIVAGSNQQLSCVDVSGVISSNTVSTTGCTKVPPGTTLEIVPGVTYTIPSQLTVPQNYEDYGLVSELYDPVVDYGWILGTIQDGMPGCIYGQIDITGSATDKFTPSWIGSGNIVITGQARVPLDVAVYGTGSIKNLGGGAETFAIAEESTGLFKITGTSIIGITAITINDGSLFGFSGAAESASVNPPDITTDLKITGTSGDPLLTHREIASGNLFAFSGGQERNSFDYAGTGTITLLPRKPETYELSELANYTLEDYTTCSPYINLSDTSFYNGHTKLGCVQLKWLNSEESHEKHTEVYDIHLCNDEPEIDYGYIINANTLSCVDVSGVISSNTVSTTGCTKVPPGTTLEIVPGITYSIQLQITQASFFEDYGFINEIYSPTRDYGWILDTTGLVCPFGNLATLNGIADQAYVRNTDAFTEGGTLKFASDVGAEIFFTPPYITEGYIGVIRGDGITVFSLLHNGSGSSIIIGNGLYSETDVFVGSGQINLFGAGVDSKSKVFTGSGQINLFGAAAAEVFVANPPENTQLFSVTGAASYVEVDAFVGSGNLSYFGGSAETVAWSPDEEQLLFSIKGAAISIFSLAHFGSGTIIVTDSAEKARVLVLPADGSISNITGEADVAFSANPPEEEPLFRFVGNKEESFSFGTYIGDGDLFSIGGSSELLGFAERPTIDIRVTGQLTERRTNKFTGSGSLFAFIGSTESRTIDLPEFKADLKFFGGITSEIFSANPPENDAKIKVSGTTTPEILTFSERSFGTVFTFGESTNVYAPNHIGTGSLFAFAGSAESVGFNPEDITTDLKIIGFAIERFTANPAEDGTEIVLSGTTSPEIRSFAEQPFGTFSIFADADTDRSKIFVGSGSLKKFSGSSESATFNPEEKDLLFSFTGGLTSEKHTETYAGVDTPIKIRRGALSDFQTYDYQPLWTGFGIITITGESADRFLKNNVGFGNIFNIGGASESTTFNPTEEQILFSFAGESAERTASSYYGEGSLFGINGSTESSTVVPPVSADIRFFGESSSKFIINNVGFGNIFNIGGASESVSFNPDERQILFSFSGFGSQSLGIAETKQIEIDITGDSYDLRSHSYFGSGSATIFGESTNRFVINNIGFGNIFNIGGASESTTFNPTEEQILFSFTGELAERTLVREISQGGTLVVSGSSVVRASIAETKQIEVDITGEAYITASLLHVGSGNLFAFSGGAESVTGVPPTEKALFKISGIATEKNTENYIGSGSLRKLSGAAESVAFNPDEQQILFTFTGTRNSEKRTSREISKGGTFQISGDSVSRSSLVHYGQGTVSVDGDAHTTRARDFIGSGTIPVFHGAAESLTFNPDERDLLFSFNGERISEKSTFREVGTLGKVRITGTSGDPLLTFAENPFVKINLSGNSVNIRSRRYIGSGRLFSFSNAKEVFARAQYEGSGAIDISGDGIIQVEVFQPPRTFIWII